MNADIVIIGAGPAGLRCGIEILEKRPSLKLVILEKYNYIGGRVVTYRKTIEDIKGKCSHLQWENGAGRISYKHTKVLELLKKYGLHTLPIGDEILYEDDGVLTKNIFTDTMRLLSGAIKELSEDYLATHTLRQVLELVLGAEEANALLLQFPYRAEVDTLRADMAIESFEGEMGTYKGYFVVKEGYAALTDAMTKDFESRGGAILKGHDVTDIQKEGSYILIKAKTNSGDVLWETPTCICTLHRDALEQIPLFKGWDVLKKLKMEPLVRTYAVFPKDRGISWFVGIPKVTSSSFVRYFLPMDPQCGTAMVSYTDGRDARKMIRMLDHYGEEKTGDLIVEELRKMFPDKTIPDPVFFKAHPWTSGCTYWLPGDYDPYEESKQALKPFSELSLYCCGESFSTRQAWVEGALEHADQLLELLLRK